ncbi:hypothetical protein FBU30_005174 [Linnemannia zychae]|nr:hypothetical protein FBU30_005174 [Linnemannia zychae]
MPSVLHSSALSYDQPQQQSPTISQLSVFSRLPSELILDIFSYLDIVTIFRFLDTCRYHRYLLINLPEIWHRIRFIPLSEYSTTYATSTFTTLSAAATAATPSSPAMAVGSLQAESSRSAINSSTARPSRYKRPIRTNKLRTSRDSSDSSSESESGSEGSDNNKATTASESSQHRLKHAENERDRERGGSRTLISEIYAVLRRFRKENRLVDFVREIYMDSTDSQHFPSPIVMLIKFPNLHTLSSRYRRKQTSLNTDTHTLKDLLRNGDIMPHSLKLRRWDIFHPYMANEDVVGFKAILDTISQIGAKSNPQDKDFNSHITDESESGVESHGDGVQLDIKMCPGPILYVPPPNQTLSPSHTASGMHWVTPITHPHPTPSNTAGTSTPPSSTVVADSTQLPLVTPTSPILPSCTSIVWTLEKCRICDAPQERCYRCVGKCQSCGAIRAPPFINHQTLLERERARQTSGRAIVANTFVTGSGTNAGSGLGSHSMTAGGTYMRPKTPPGSISLSQMTYSTTQPIPTAYPHLASSPAGSISLTGLTSPPPIVAPATLTLPPEFSLFD